MKITKLNFINIFIIFTGIIVVIDMWMIFIWVPTEINQGAIHLRNGRGTKDALEGGFRVRRVI